MGNGIIVLIVMDQQCHLTSAEDVYCLLVAGFYHPIHHNISDHQMGNKIIAYRSWQ